MSHAETTPAWRDNKTVLRLVRVGFFLQFYLPVIGIIPFFYGSNFATSPSQSLQTLCIFMGIPSMEFIFPPTLFFLIMQWGIFTAILQIDHLRSARRTLLCLIAVNMLYGVALIFIWWPYALLRLLPPSMLYGIAVLAEQGTTAGNEAPAQ